MKKITKFQFPPDESTLSTQYRSLVIFCWIWHEQVRKSKQNNRNLNCENNKQNRSSQWHCWRVKEAKWICPPTQLSSHANKPYIISFRWYEIGQICQKCKHSWEIKFIFFIVINPFSQSLSDSSALRMGSGLLIGIAGISSFFINKHFRQKLKVGHYGRGSSYLAVIGTPAMLSGLIHYTVRRARLQSIFHSVLQYFYLLFNSTVYPAKSSVDRIRLSCVRWDEIWIDSRHDLNNLAIHSQSSQLFLCRHPTLHLSTAIAHREAERNFIALC